MHRRMPVSQKILAISFKVDAARNLQERGRLRRQSRDAAAGGRLPPARALTGQGRHAALEITGETGAFSYRTLG